MRYIFKTRDKTGRTIILTKERWAHIRIEHSNVENFWEIEICILRPDKIISDEREDVNIYFKYFKHKKRKPKFLKTIIKYLNGEGFVISAHFVRKIK